MLSGHDCSSSGFSLISIRCIVRCYNCELLLIFWDILGSVLFPLRPYSLPRQIKLLVIGIAVVLFPLTLCVIIILATKWLMDDYCTGVSKFGIYCFSYPCSIAKH